MIVWGKLQSRVCLLKVISENTLIFLLCMRHNGTRLGSGSEKRESFALS